MSIVLPLKSVKSNASLTAGPEFATWSQENLAKFASESYTKLQEQEDEIQRLKLDLRTAIEAYRALIRQE